MSGDIAVVLAADAAYLKQLAVTITGISATAGGRRHQVFVLHDGVDLESLMAAAECAGTNVELRWLDVATVRDESGTSLSHPRFHRLHVEELLPADLERVIYLDVDIIVRRSLADLWSFNLGEALVGAVGDAYHPFAFTRLAWRELGVAPSLPYFNSGVLLIPLPRWRSERVGPRCRELLVTGRVIPSDQDALNAVLAGDWLSIGPRWNLQTHHLVGDKCHAWAIEPRHVLDDALADPAIVHFCAGTFNRPWDAPTRHPYRQEWFDLLDRTPWRGWRPKPEPLTTRVPRRVRRATRVLLKGS